MQSLDALRLNEENTTALLKTVKKFSESHKVGYSFNVIKQTISFKGDRQFDEIHWMEFILRFLEISKDIELSDIIEGNLENISKLQFKK